ncbi:MAG: FecR family protein, partial [Mangrovibacterium sp.]
GMFVHVYGTTFNVCAFPVESSVKVTLVEGAVSLTSGAGKFDGKNEYFMSPGQTVVFEKTCRTLQVRHEDPFLYTAWKDGLLVFRNTTFENVLKRLSRQFNADIALRDSLLASIPMDATFRNEGLDEILRLLSESTSFCYAYENPVKLPGGAYEKRKINIWRK